MLLLLFHMYCVVVLVLKRFPGVAHLVDPLSGQLGLGTL